MFVVRDDSYSFFVYLKQKGDDHMKKGLLVMENQNVDLVYPDHIKQAIQSHVEFVAPPMTAQELAENRHLLKDIHFIFTGWGGPRLDETFFKFAPHLEAVFYAAGSIRPITTDLVWENNITITSAYAANAVPVAEYTLSQILFSLKKGWHIVRETRNNRSYQHQLRNAIIGNFESVIGVISLSTIGRKVIEMLAPFDLNVKLYDPFATAEEAAALNVELCSLDELFQSADVVSLHTPLLQETIGMITGEHLKQMKQHATFINTARGAIVKEREMTDVLAERSDLTAIIDVTHPEPPKSDSPLYTLPNIVLTPHIAGSIGPECGRMGAYMLAELKRYLNHEPLQWQITKETFQNMA